MLFHIFISPQKTTYSHLASKIGSTLSQWRLWVGKVWTQDLEWLRLGPPVLGSWDLPTIICCKFPFFS